MRPFSDDDERTAVRSYTKGELAMMYSPRAKYESAIRMLNRYLHRCRGLMDELMALGYRPDESPPTSSAVTPRASRP